MKKKKLNLNAPKQKNNKQRKLLIWTATIAILILILIGIICVSIYQYNRPVKTLCDQAEGTCAVDCGGYNLADPGRRAMGCTNGLICCLK